MEEKMKLETEKNKKIDQKTIDLANNKVASPSDVKSKLEEQILKLF